MSGPTEMGFFYNYLTVWQEPDDLGISELDDVLAQLEDIQTGSVMACAYDYTAVGILVNATCMFYRGRVGTQKSNQCRWF